MTVVLPKRLLAAGHHKQPVIGVSPIVVESASVGAAEVYARLGTRPGGLTATEATTRLGQYGPNALAHDHRAGVFARSGFRDDAHPRIAPEVPDLLRGRLADHREGIAVVPEPDRHGEGGAVGLNGRQYDDLPRRKKALDVVVGEAPLHDVMLGM